LSPFFSQNEGKNPLLYKGIGMNLVNYENYQLYNLIKAEPTTFSKNYKTGQAIRAGTAITLLAGVQGLNNARAILAGSLHFFSNDALSNSAFGNKNVVVDLLRWVFREKGVIRVKTMNYHGEGVEHKETLFNVGEKLYFTAEIEEHDSASDTWKPYIADDLQVELVMLDPWVRTTLVKGQGNNYHAEFYVHPLLFRPH
jgi:oligosaccharyltransferase complex subunit beta